MPILGLTHRLMQQCTTTATWETGIVCFDWFIYWIYIWFLDILPSVYLQMPVFINCQFTQTTIMSPNIHSQHWKHKFHRSAFQHQSTGHKLCRSRLAQSHTPPKRTNCGSVLWGSHLQWFLFGLPQGAVVFVPITDVLGPCVQVGGWALYYYVEENFEQ